MTCYLHGFFFGQLTYIIFFGVLTNYLYYLGKNSLQHVTPSGNPHKLNKIVLWSVLPIHWKERRQLKAPMSSMTPRSPTYQARVTSHTSQGSRPCSYEDLWFSSKGRTIDTVCYNLRHAYLSEDTSSGTPWNIICSFPCKFLIHDSFFGPLSLHLIVWIELGRSPTSSTNERS